MLKTGAKAAEYSAFTWKYYTLKNAGLFPP